MYFCKLAALLLLVIMISACGNNLIPSGEDKRASVPAGSIGGNLNQKSPDFTLSATNGSTVTLASSLSGKKGAVFYFTMWCPICDTHQSNLRSTIVPSFPDVNVYLVDYVSGSVSSAASAASASGYADFITLADSSKILLNIFGATMGTTIVIDSSGSIRMNEDYRDGAALRSILSGLP